MQARLSALPGILREPSGDPPGTLRGPSYLRGPSGGTAPWPEHRPRPPLAVPGQPDNGAGGERSPAGSDTSPPRSPPAPTAWRGPGGSPGKRLLPGTAARKCGQRYLRREFDLSLAGGLMSRLGGVALPRTARGERDGAPTSLPEPPGPRRNPRPAGGGNDSRLESSIAATAATHPAATATSCIATAVGDSRQQGGETEAAGWPRCQGTARAGASSQTRAVFFSRNAAVTCFIWDGASRDKAKPVENAETTCLSMIKYTRTTKLSETLV